MSAEQPMSQQQRQQQQQQETMNAFFSLFSSSSAMGIQSQRANSAIRKCRQFGTIRRRNLRQTAVNDRNANGFDPNIDCKTCVRGGSSMYKKPHHVKCPKNKKTKGLPTSKRTQEVEQHSEQVEAIMAAEMESSENEATLNGGCTPLWRRIFLDQMTMINSFLCRRTATVAVSVEIQILRNNMENSPLNNTTMKILNSFLKRQSGRGTAAARIVVFHAGTYLVMFYSCVSLCVLQQSIQQCFFFST
jgi:hypothetical protein